MATSGRRNAADVPSSSRKEVPSSEAGIYFEPPCSETEKSCNGTPCNQEGLFSKQDTSGSSGKRKERKWDIKPEDSDALQVQNEVVKRRKTRWSSDDDQLKRLGSLQFPDFQGTDGTKSDLEVQDLNRQLMDINTKLLELQNETTSNPVSNESGLRIDANKIRMKFIRRKQKIFSKLVEKTLGFKSQSDKKPATIYKKLYIPVKQYPEYNFIGLILGPRGNTLKRMETETGARIVLRGKGSVRDDKILNNNKTDYSENEDLHVRIEANNKKSLDAAVQMVKKLLVPVEDNANDLKRKQLYDLAVLNGKVAGSCDICGDNSHLTQSCPLIASALKAGQHDGPLSGLGASIFSSSTSVPVPISVNPGPESSACTSNAKCIDEANLFVGYLPNFIDERRLKQLFDPFGTISSVKLVRDPATGASKGHGFIRYCDPASAVIAIEKMHKLVMGNKILVVQVAGIPSTTIEGSASPASTYPSSPPNPQVMSTVAGWSVLPQYCGYINSTVPSFPPAALTLPVSMAAHTAASITPTPNNVSSSLGTLAGTSKAEYVDDANLFVGCLPDSFDEVSLKQLFDPFGTIAGLKVARDPVTNACKRYGFVRYRDPASAAIAIEKMHNYPIENRGLIVRIAGVPPNPPGSSASLAPTYAGSPADPQTTPTETVWPALAQYHGHVTSFDPSVHGNSTPANLNLETSAGTSKAEGMDEANLYVGFLPKSIDEVSLKQLFDTFGTLTGVKVVREPDTGVSKGYGFVRYSDPASAAVAIEKMHKFQIGNKTLVVRIANRPPPTPAISANSMATYPSSPAKPQATSAPTVWPDLTQSSGYFTQTNSAALVPPVSLGALSSVPGFPPLGQPLSLVADHPTFPGRNHIITQPQPMSLAPGHCMYRGAGYSTLTAAHPTAVAPSVPGHTPFTPVQPTSSHVGSSLDVANGRYAGGPPEAGSMFPFATILTSTQSGASFSKSLDVKNDTNLRIHLPSASGSLFSPQAMSHTATFDSGTESFPGNPDYYRSKLL